MKIDKKHFYDTVRPHFAGSKISESQVEGMESILDYWQDIGYTDLRWLAYIMATVFHETAQRMKPIEEFGKGRGRRYGSKVKHSGESYTNPDKIYYGRGRVQLTWYENYQLMGRLLDIDLLNNPELMLKDDVDVQVLFEGMTKGASSFGDFTGKCLEMYFNDTTEDPVHARRIINGLDKADQIAGYYRWFLEGLREDVQWHHKELTELELHLAHFQEYAHLLKRIELDDGDRISFRLLPALAGDMVETVIREYQARVQDRIYQARVQDRISLSYLTARPGFSMRHPSDK